ncbi:ESX secretion-associated protein EspG [Rhodococcus rhodnii]|uniref:ESX secretion-associated protein EspG n=2 Tax=Rhodococcus rhodnii TaxID=38312 RepID=R7WRY2_9NOCA|nr:ESX secretion-associated protein EspG [Rhodococcus rhodnii]EOM78078.1 hypothetical protein Rrhod_0551 [Rhodococcus rhodnii LMG 5362]TXG90116.1 ESX secretion-associated protein EspG [Rhodococcus rhodnii]
MMRECQIRSDQFAALWSETGLDESPYPLHLGVSAPTLDEHERLQQQIRAHFAGEAGDGVRDVIRVLATPEVFVEVSGIDASGSRIRVLGARNQQFGAVAVQFPGARDDLGGEIRLRLIPGSAMGTAIAALLPPNAPGTRVFARNDEPEPDYFSGRILQDVAAPARASRFEAAVRAGYAGAGTIRVATGPRYADSEVAWLRWFDIAGDGRYVITSRDENAAKSARGEQVGKWCDRMMTQGIETFREARVESVRGGWA